MGTPIAPVRLMRISFIFSIVLFASCRILGGALMAEEGYTALVTAYDPEIEELMDYLEATPEFQLLAEEKDRGVHYRLGQFGEEPVVIFVTGMSIANAAMTLQMALDRYPIDRVLYSGIAGAVNPDLKVGDVVIPARWYYHDESAYFNPVSGDPENHIVADYFLKTSRFYPENRPDDPHIPGYDNFGMIYPDEVLVIKEGWEKPEEVSYFAAEESFLAATTRALEDLPTLPVTEGRDARIFVGGNGVTGSVFVDHLQYRQWLRQVWKAEVTEMESAAIGQVCFVNEVPWVIVRGVSDLAGGQSGKNEENIFDRVASLNAARVLVGILRELESPAED